ncbi:carbon starvation CstA family protein [Aureliella helgolandensis]|uniref:Inner membrane protein YjiY n=1 Tax=Aureliella helgolandensis TaxID=2527968 RepID=A0A518G2P0_9BACT|nr:carbon starvation protein A [Aureliella helgolandensis]QDV22830.1 Inner membrane protein YjiY [Aureliella helgolandensis]
MSTLFVCLGALALLLIAYFTYGKWLSNKLFELSADSAVPSKALRDDQDFVPTKRSIVFGHHFTSIAGTGPIVGPAIAVFWGWLPALLWVVFGAILIGGVHDMAALVISIRNRGQTLGEVAGRMISPRARILFLSILALALWIVLAIFGLVIANIFALYPESVLSVWMAMPIAIGIGFWVHRRGKSITIPSILSLIILYAAVYVGVYYLPLDLALWLPDSGPGSYLNPIVVWTVLLLIYCFAASVLPVWLLLQPRDLVNSQQLFVALSLLVLGLIVASLTGSADLMASTEAVSTTIPADAPPIFPFLFITIACGACSGFHCLVSSGTSSKQVECERDAQAVGYGAMLLESALAVVVILACTAGVGMGALQKQTNSSEYSYQTSASGEKLVARDAWRTYYRTGDDGGWSKQTLAKKLAAFIEGGANFLTAIGIPVRLGIGIVAVLVASFAATTLDTATRLQRYVLQELGGTLRLPAAQNKYVATTLAVTVGGAIAIFAGDAPGKGGLMLWPLFGATNQLLAGLALLVATFYLWRRSKTIAFLAIPTLLMMLVPGWAMTYDLWYNWIPQGKYQLVAFGVSILVLQVWVFFEALIVWKKARGVLEPQLAPLPSVPGTN